MRMRRLCLWKGPVLRPSMGLRVLRQTAVLRRTVTAEGRVGRVCFEELGKASTRIARRTCGDAASGWVHGERRRVGCSVELLSLVQVSRKGQIRERVSSRINRILSTVLLSAKGHARQH